MKLEQLWQKKKKRVTGCFEINYSLSAGIPIDICCPIHIHTFRISNVTPETASKVRNLCNKMLAVSIKGTNWGFTLQIKLVTIIWSHSPNNSMTKAQRAVAIILLPTNVIPPFPLRKGSPTLIPNEGQCYVATSMIGSALQFFFCLHRGWTRKVPAAKMPLTASVWNI